MSTKPTCDLENITYQYAVTLLQSTEEIGFHNRRPTASVVDKYVGDISRGDWFTDTGETIKLALKDGKEYVIDGQHRLMAIIQSRQAVKLWVFRYIPEEAFQYIDQGKPRELKDIMTINNNGWASEAAVLSSAGRMLWKEDRTGDAAKKPSGTSMESEGNIADYLFTQYDDLPATYEFWRKYCKNIQAGGLGGSAWVLYLARRWSEVEAAETLPVMQYLAAEGELQHAVKMKMRTPSSPTARKIILKHSETPVKPPSNVWRYAVDYVTAARTEHEQIDTKGKRRILKGRNQDLLTATVRAYMFSWNLDRSGEKLKNKEAFELALLNYVDECGNIIGKAI